MKIKYIAFLLPLLLTGCTMIFGEEQLVPQEYQQVYMQPRVEETSNIPQQGGMINISMRNPLTLNPILNRDITVDRVLSLLYESLEDMVSEIEIAEDYTFAILTLKNAKWEDGEPITARDVTFTIETIRNNPDSLYTEAISNIAGFSAVDDNHVLLTFATPKPGRVEESFVFPIIPAHFFANNLRQRNMETLASGPFKMDTDILPREMTLRNNPQSFKSVYLDKINVIITPDLQTDVHALNQGTIDVLSNNSGLLELGLSSVGFNVKSYETNNIDFIAFNFDNPIIRDVRIRQAILYSAIPDDIISNVYLGQGVRASSVVHTSSENYREGLNYFKYDTAHAIGLFSLAGFSYIGEDTLGTVVAGIPVPMNLRILVNEENEERVQVARLLRHNLEAMGISIEYMEVDFETYLQQVNARNFDIIFGGVNINPYWDLRFLLGTGGSQNVMNYQSAHLDMLLNRVINAPDTESFRNAMLEMQDYTNEEVPLYVIAFRHGTLLVSGEVGGEIAPSQNNIFRDIENWFIRR